MKTWIKQRKKDVDRLGKTKSPWVVFWNTPEGLRREKTCGTGRDGWRLARKVAEKINGELISGTYGEATAVTWAQFRKDYESHIDQRLSTGSRKEIRTSLNAFERIAKPTRMSNITTRAIDDFISKRTQESGKKMGDRLSPATANKDLRHIKAAIRKAVKWNYLSTMPDVEFLREPETAPQYVTPDDFKKIYEACDGARKPKQLPCSPPDGWKALLVTLMMTGWRIGETLQLRWDDVDLGNGTARLRAFTTKAKRDAVIQLHPVVVEHLEKVRSFQRLVFHWPNHRRTLIWNSIASKRQRE